MFLHSNKVLSTIFKNHICNNLNTFRPILISGFKGVGKFTYISSFIRSLSNCTKWDPFTNNESSFQLFNQDCDCLQCQKILTNKSEDVLILQGEGIQEFKELIQNFINHNPVELNHRWLVLRDLNSYSHDILNSFLKILEEPYPYLKILATATSLEAIPKAIISRFHLFHMNSLDKESLEIIVSNTPTLKPFKVLLNKYDFISIFQLISYRKFFFEDNFTDFFVNPNNVVLLERDILSFLSLVKSDPNFKYEEVLNFFLQYFIAQVFEFCDRNDTPSLKLFKAHFNSILRMYSKSLFRYINSPINYFYINLEKQIISFILSTYQLKLLAHT